MKPLPPRFLLPSWTTSQFRAFHATVRTSRPDSEAPSETHLESRAEGEPQKEESSLRTKSLLEELFPEKTKRQHLEASTNQEVPRLPLLRDAKYNFDRGIPPVVRLGHLEAVKRAAQQKERKTEVYGPPPEEAEPVVLLLQNASSNLAEGDFRRSIPRGRHIGEWRRLGDILKVIPGRDAVTLEPRSFYFILFASTESSEAFQEHAIQLYKLTNDRGSKRNSQKTATSLGSPADSQTPGDLRRAFTLAPVGQKPVLKLYARPLPRSIEKIVKQGGYMSKLPARDREVDNPPNTTVLLHIEGGDPLPRIQTIQKLLCFDEKGQIRSNQWAVADRGKAIGCVEELQLSQAKKPRVQKEGEVKSASWEEPLPVEEQTPLPFSPVKTGPPKHVWRPRPEPEERDTSKEPQLWAPGYQEWTTVLDKKMFDDLSWEEKQRQAKSRQKPEIQIHPHPLRLRSQLPKLAKAKAKPLSGKDAGKQQDKSTDQGQDPNKEQQEETRWNGRGARWLITFESGTEARRFVRAWHKRRLPRDAEPNGEWATGPGTERLLNAAVLW